MVTGSVETAQELHKLVFIEVSAPEVRQVPALLSQQDPASGLPKRTDKLPGKRTVLRIGC